MKHFALSLIRDVIVKQHHLVYGQLIHTLKIFPLNIIERQPTMLKIKACKQAYDHWTAKVEFSPNSGLFQSDLCQSQPVLICENSEDADENWLRVTEATLEQP